MTNEPNFAVGAVLEQLIDGQWKPISFFSKKLNSAELNDSAFDWELLAVYLAVRHFQYFVEGCPFNINTDSKPLTFALQSNSEWLSPQQAWHLAFISEFTSDIRHINGDANPVADALSYNVYTLIEAAIELEAITAAQLCDQEIQHLSSTNTSLQLEQLPIPNSNTTILCDSSQGTPRPTVPSTMRHDIFNKIHSLSHPGIKASRHLVS